MNDSQYLIELNEDEVLCRAGDKETDLYVVLSGELMICARENRMVTPLAYLKKNDYFGELSFFDHKPRSADVVAISACKLLKIPKSNLSGQLPFWMVSLGQNMSAKIRLLDKVISEKGIKRQNVESVKPLSIEQQRYYYELLTND
ncbi:MAG: hypothetical protein CME62_04805 [Halobacteriovoraceae bacterium]|nr:hypothetical protein [Halobacteriovoraceae bacterium]|tara:strand:- start:9599 stop:10033 length:435 start_codon:yes stop_codon:yes gene_type:complete